MIRFKKATEVRAALPTFKQIIVYCPCSWFGMMDDIEYVEILEKCIKSRRNRFFSIVIRLNFLSRCLGGGGKGKARGGRKGKEGGGGGGQIGVGVKQRGGIGRELGKCK